MRKFRKNFLGRFFYRQKIIPKPCRNILRQVIRSPFKNMSCIILGNIFAMFLQCFRYGTNCMKSKILRSFREIFLTTLSKGTFHEILWEEFEKILEKIVSRNRNCKKKFPKPCRNISRQYIYKDTLKKFKKRLLFVFCN